jgi:hypothetical protein
MAFSEADMNHNPSQTSADLHLVAVDAEDLALVSAHLQDALVRVGDMAWLPEQSRFAMVVSRFDWLAAQNGRCERATTGLHFDRVRTVRQTGVPQQTPEVVLNLLAVTFAPTEAPAGLATLTFSGGAAIRLDVECLEAAMADLGPRWTAKSKPVHPLDGGPAQGS